MLGNMLEAQEPTAEVGTGSNAREASKPKSAVFGAHAGYVLLDWPKGSIRRTRGGSKLTQSIKQDVFKFLEAFLEVGTQEVVDAALGVGLQNNEGGPQVEAIGNQVENLGGEGTGVSKDLGRVSNAVDRGLGFPPVRPRNQGTKQGERRDSLVWQVSRELGGRVPNPSPLFCCPWRSGRC